MIDSVTFAIISCWTHILVNTTHLAFMVWTQDIFWIINQIYWNVKASFPNIKISFPNVKARFSFISVGPRSLLNKEQNVYCNEQNNTGTNCTGEKSLLPCQTYFSLYFISNYRYIASLLQIWYRCIIALLQMDYSSIRNLFTVDH